MSLAVVLNKSNENTNFFDKDIWTFAEIGVATPITKSDYQVSFKGITQEWLKSATKKFIKLMALTRTYSVLLHYATSMKYFSYAIEQFGDSGTEADITRELAISYMSHLKSKGLSADTRKKRILNVKLFIEMAIREKWLNIPNGMIFYAEDIPKMPKSLPRFIPESVMTQLNHNIDKFEPTIMRLLLVLQECGMRISEIATLKRDCLISDSDGDYFLKTQQSKMNKEHSIPISQETYQVIMEQLRYVDDCYGRSCEWVFPMERVNRCGRRNSGASKPYKTKTIIAQLNNVAKIAHITGDNGQVFHFTTHMFRHTVGTRMINNGVPQHIVQRYLGHESPNMTSTYAHVMDSTMKREFAKFKGGMVDVAGNVVDEESVARDISQGADNVDAQWLKRHISAQALPNGLCAMPALQSCDKANACLTCGNFRTDARYLDQHKEQLERTCSILDTAKQNGWTRQIEMNEKLKQNLLNIIEPLEAQNDA